MTVRTATRDDLPLLRDIVRRANDTPYDFDAVAEEKLFGRGFSGDPRVRVFGDAGVAVTCGTYLRLLVVDRAERGRGIGTALLRDAAPRVIAAEPGNYFTPGVLESQASFFQRRGFCATARTWNLHVEPLRADEETNSQFSILHSSPSPELLEFVRREFGAIWAFEIERAQKVVWIPDTGFAAIEANNRGLGTFGPTGVTKGHRGRGHGRALLRAALRELAAMGYGRAIIPWTDAVDFYRRACGAEPAHGFVALRAC